VKSHVFLLTIAAGMLALLSTSWVWAQSSSQARIVRLSFVEGNVTIARPDISSWAQAPVNTPLEEGFRLSTGENAFAEVQLENGGTIRLGQLGLLDFRKLALTAGGGKVNHLQLEQGYATFHALLDNGEDSYQVVTPNGTLTAEGNALFRVDLDQGVARVEVFKGTVSVASNLGAWTLDKNSVLELRPDVNNPGIITQGITEDDWDQWVEDRESQPEMEQTGPQPNSYSDNTGETPYGWNDLQEYGNWSYLPGEGYGWMPGAVGSGWGPYSSGQWTWYPGWGYTWISAEPWGWLPFHYGVWEFVPGMGWVWFPGNLGTWSPALVAWYSGPGWIGWAPLGRPIRRPCMGGKNCGGGAMSTTAFRNGGVVSSKNTVAFNPAAGERISSPKIQPTTAAMLTGQAFAQPAAYTHQPGGAMTGTTGTAISPRVAAASGMPAAGSSPPDRGIVYDPKANSYVNSSRARPAPEPAASQPGAATTAPGGRPALIQPVPVGGRTQSSLPAEGPGRPAPSPAMGYGYARANAAPSSTANTHPAGVASSGPSVVHSGGGSEGSHGGAGFAGAHSGGGGVGGGAPGGGHH